MGNLRALMLRFTAFFTAHTVICRPYTCEQRRRDDALYARINKNCIPNIPYTMSQYIKSDHIIRVSGSSTLAIHRKLPCGTYLLEFEEQTQQFYLKQIEDFCPSGKIYGEHRLITERVINTFMCRANSNLGVLLSGVKGSGKTLTSKLISTELARRYGYATIIINQGYHTASLASFLHSIDAPCMVIFDEFDKVYSYKESEAASQSGLLDILDGVFESRKLFVMSCNEVSKLNPFFFSRPGRVFYHYRYGGLSEEVISQYCDDNLLYPERKGEIVQLSSFVRDMTFDILKAVVEETNRYNESPRCFMEHLNINYSLDGVYDVLLCYANGCKITTLRKQSISFGNRGWSVTLPRTEENIALTRLQGSFLRDDAEDDEVYGYYTPEAADLMSVNRDGTLELALCGGNLRAYLSRSSYTALDYATLIAKL